MANFDAQIQALAGTANNTEMNDWAANGAKEIINVLPPNLKAKCTTFTLLNASATIVDLDAIGEIMHVTRENADSGYYAPCRKIPAMYGDMSNDSGNMMHYASETDPVYWIDSNGSNAATLFVKPTPTDAQPAKAYHISYPSITCSDVSTIPNFPDEAEYLVVLYASVKVLQNKMNEMNSNTDITTAFTATKTELDETQALADSVNAEIVLSKADVVLAKAEVVKAITEAGELATQTDGSSSGIVTALAAIKTAADRMGTYNWTDGATFDTTNKQLTRVKDALDNAQKIIDDGANSPTGDAAGDAATYLFTEEDTELVESTIKIADSEIKRAQTHIAEWVSIIEGALTEVNAFSREVESRTGFSGAKSLAIKGYIDTANSYVKTAEGYIKTATAYGQEIQLKIGIAGAYIQEAAARMQENQQQYQWYQAQQMKLQQDYDKGVKMLVSGSVSYGEEEKSKRQ
jgi:hypothetical protein